MIYDTEGLRTQTSDDIWDFYRAVEERWAETVNDPCDTNGNREVFSDAHLEFLNRQLAKKQNMNYSMQTAWLASWFSNGFFAVLGTEQFRADVVQNRFHPVHKLADQILALQTNGFSGGPGHLPHLGNTYAALVLLHSLGRMNEVNKEGVVSLIRDMKKGRGFTIHRDGESDVRSIFCAVASYSLIHSGTVSPKTQYNPLCDQVGASLFSTVVHFLHESQTFEGGFGAAPGEEAHGGYTYCSIASLLILEQPIYSQDFLRKWLEERQDPHVLGFNGRTNKCADSCYNYWIGASMRMLGIPYNRPGLRQFTLGLCQKEEGGISSVPGMGADVYHTAYALLGLLPEDAHFNFALGVPTAIHDLK